MTSALILGVGGLREGGLDWHKYILTLHKPHSTVKTHGTPNTKFPGFFETVELKHWVKLLFKVCNNPSKIIRGVHLES
jgi:hypothetical protein